MVENQELIDRLKNVEDNFTERKPDGVKSDEIRKTIVAFSNSGPEGRTGVLFIGIRDNGDIQGVSNPDSLQKTIRAICEKDCYPPIQPQIEVLPLQGQSVVAVVIPESRSRPHFSGPAYIRIGSESVPAPPKVLEELITSRLEKPYEILKWKGKKITVLISVKVVGAPPYIERECEIEGCTPHYVKLYDIQRGLHLSESLENVALATDEKRNSRLKLILNEKSLNTITQFYNY